MKEKALLLGASKKLVAVLAEPEHRDTDCAAVLLNAGIIHRVGPNRLSVKLARALAAIGIPAVRFDSSGLGDSVSRSDGLPYGQSRLMELREVLDDLQTQFDLHRFVAMGLCSGADLAFRIAAQEPRVIGAVMMDGYCYPTRGYYVRRWARSAFRWRSWRNVWRRHAAWRIRGTLARQGLLPAEQATPFVMDVPSRREAVEMLDSILAQHKQLLFTFTGGMADGFNGHNQFREMFPEIDISSVCVEYWPDMDHTVTQISHQRLAIESIANWAKRFAGARIDANEGLISSQQV